jgi:hypothetical protein
MPLHENALARLKELVAAAAPKLQVEFGRFLTAESYDVFADGDAALPKEVIREFIGSISEHPFTTFATGYIQNRLNDLSYSSEKRAVPLLDLPVFHTARALADETVTAFATLPWKYAFLFLLPIMGARRWGPAHKTAFQHAGAGLSLVRPGDDFSEVFSPRNPHSLAALANMLGGSEAAGKWEPGLYVLIESDGFLADWMETELIKRARLLLRTVGGLLTATKLAHVTHQGAHAYAAEGEILVYQKQMDRWVSRRPFRLEAETMQLFRSLQWDDFADLQPENGDWSGWDRLVSRFLRPAFEEREETVLLRRTSQWYFDSLAGTNNLLKFVQATVAIEILSATKQHRM